MVLTAVVNFAVEGVIKLWLRKKQRDASANITTAAMSNAKFVELTLRDFSVVNITHSQSNICTEFS